jgi:DNA-binding SARP family transcriptional activator
MRSDDLASDPVVTVFGRVAVVTGTTVHTPGSAGQRLLAMLAVAHPHPVPYEVVAEGAAPALGPDEARRALRSTVWRLRQAAGAALIVTERGSYRLGVRPAELDLTRFEGLAIGARDALLRNHPEQAEERARLAVAAWVGEPFAGLRDVPGVDEKAAAAGVMLGDAIEDWADAAIRLGRPRIALDRLVALCEAEPVRERAWALRLDAFRALDQWDDVARTRTLATEALAEVGIEPGSDLRAALDRARGTPMVSPLPGMLDRRPDVGTPAWMRVASDHGTFIGRDDERKVLVNAVSAAAERRTTVMVIRGEPGVGKTRLIAQVGTELAERSVLVLGGRCDRYGLVPFAPLVAPLRHLMTTTDPVASARLTSGPLGRLVAPGSGETEGHDAATEQQALFAAVVDLFRLAAGDETMVLVIDDIQWASSATVLLLRHLVTAAPDLRLCLMLTARGQPGARHTDMDPAALLATVPSASVLRLGGLRISDIAAHPDLAAEPDPNATARRLMQQTGGNPLLLTAALRSRDHHRGDDRLEPLILEAAIEAHLECFAPDERDVLGLAAAAGPDVDPMLLRVAGPKLGLAPSAVNRALDSAETAGVVDLADAGWYVFHHDLLRECLLDSLPGTRRAEFHAALADAIETLGDAATGPALFDLAGHLHRARSVVQPERIRDATIRAAEAAAADLDFDAAAQLYERAADASGRTRSGGQTELLLTSAFCARFAGEPARAFRLLALAVEAARTSTDPLWLARAVVARGKQELQIFGSVDDETLRQAEIAYEGVMMHDAGLAGELWFLRAIGTRGSGNLAQALGTIDRAIGTRGSGNLAQALAMIDGAAALEAEVGAFQVAAPDERPAIAELIRTTAADLDGIRPRFWTVLAGWIAEIEQGVGLVDGPAAEELADLATRATDQPMLQWIHDTWTVARHMGAGRLVEARRAIDATYDRARAAGLPVEELARAHNVRRGHHITLAYFSGVTGRLDLVVEPFNSYVSLDSLIGHVVSVIGFALAGRADEGAAQFAAACDEALAPGRIRHDHLGVVCLLATGAEMSRDTRRAVLIRDELMPWRGHHALLSPTQILGAVDHWLGFAHRALGDFDAAVDAFAAAREQERRQGADAWVAMSTSALARTLTMRDEAGDRAEAVRLADEVLPWAEAAGMQTVAGLLRTTTEPFRR